jgi:hypothetical protein
MAFIPPISTSGTNATINSMASRTQTFIPLCVLCFMLISTGYFLAVDQALIPHHPVPKSYRHFMLQASNSVPNRLIVEAGSSAIHGIDITMLEEATQRASFNIADSAGYPFQHKIYRLQQNLNPGDLVILPLEWLHYSDDAVLSANYVKSLVDPSAANAFYYHGLPLWPRLKFTFMKLPYHLAFESFLDRAIQKFEHPNQTAATNNDLNRLRSRIDLGDRGSSPDNERLTLHWLTKGLRCTSYLFGVYGSRYTVSDHFLDNLALLQQVRSETGAEIVFTWPTVVAKNEDACYAGSTLYLLEPHADNIKSQVENAGFVFLGHYKDSEYSSECMRDTYYHVIHDCAVERTRKLIEQLAAEGIRDSGSYDPGRSNQALTEEWSDLASKVDGLQ